MAVSSGQKSGRDEEVTVRRGSTVRVLYSFISERLHSPWQVGFPPFPVNISTAKCTRVLLVTILK